MRAVVRTSREKGAVSVEEVERPEISPNEVLIRTQAAGVCGSDVGAYLAKPEYDFMSVPAVLGHECAGIVDSVGTNVTRVSPGDRVVFQPGTPCGSCFQCLTGEPCNCSEREVSVAAGGFAPITAANEENVLPVPDGISMKSAALTEPLAVTHRAVVTNGEVCAGDSVLVQGPGPMGAFSALVARAVGANVVVTGLPSDDARLELLSELGIETATVGDGTDPTSLIEEFASHDGFDVTIDATGVADGVETSVSLTRNGGTVVVLGIVSDDVEFDMAALVRSEIHVRTSHGSVNENYLRAMELLSPPDPLPIDHLIDDGYTPTDPAAAFDAFTDAEAIKPVFDIDELVEA